MSADKAPGPGITLTALDFENLPYARQSSEHRATPSRQSDNVVLIGFPSTDLKCAKCQHGASINSRSSQDCAIRDTMPKRSRTEISDPNRSAFNVVQQMFKEAKAKGKDPLVVALGRHGGLIGGRARAEKLTAAQRRASAKKAARARWSKKAS